MSFSDNESSSHGGEYKFFRQTSRDRLLFEMLGSAKSDSKSWKVLIMDKVTVKVMSHSCKMADITDQGVSLVEDLFRRRQPLPSMDALYFIQPSKENGISKGFTLFRHVMSLTLDLPAACSVVMFLSDMSGREPLYKKAYVFFSSPVPKELLNHIKCDTSVLPRIGALREMNLEYFPIDNQAFITDHERALEELYVENAEKSRNFNVCLNTMAKRIATVFASLKNRTKSVSPLADEICSLSFHVSTGQPRITFHLNLSPAVSSIEEFPCVRYRAAKASDPSLTTFRDSIPEKLATAVWDIVVKYKSIPNFPQTETCELLILDRSVDQVPSKIGGAPEKKEVLLEDHDPVWLELRHSHIADASERLHDKMTNLMSKNKAAQMQQNRDGVELSTRDLQKVVQALPQFNEQRDRLSLHVELAGRINQIIRDAGLRDLGQLEQDLVFGDAGAKEVINFLRTKQDTTPENKLRLLMIYSSVYPEKFEDDKASKLMQLARLSPEDMKVVNNMRLLGGSSDSKKTSTSSFSLKFDGQKELIENLGKGEFPKDGYACMNDPKPVVQEDTISVRKKTAPTTPAPSERKTPAHSKRSRRTPSWAKPQLSDDGSSRFADAQFLLVYTGDSSLYFSSAAFCSDSILKHASAELDLRKMGQRIFVFIIGGATRSELRVCHKLTTKLRREVVLGSTSFDDPPQYLTKLKLLSEMEISAGANHGF
ncbi:hypothetical protein JRO89_XS01G0299500 [Xanthoceras sorbifolium]|uniref:Protein transport Sec1a n=1 Tax=Xanthoceras sorbifolium TaxID=99658 RepID=A0ABQ8IM79_9ROSI|nr:hypothetical protein JRO89_XS01G0299500 [Xanthoceras sorbifolium]